MRMDENPPKERKKRNCKPHATNREVALNKKKAMSEATKNVTYEMVYNLAAVGCTLDEIASTCKVSPRWLDFNFADAARDGRANMCSKLRAKQLEIALKGNVVMLIFLGKAYLGQYDTQRVETKVEQTNKFESTEELDKRLQQILKQKVKQYADAA